MKHNLQRLSEISCSDDNKVMIFIQAEYLSDLCIKILNIIPVSLLSESSEIIQILTYLGCGDVHLFAEITG